MLIKSINTAKGDEKMKRLVLVILSVMCFNIFAHFPIPVNTDESKGLISNVAFGPLQIGIGFFDNFQLYDGEVHTFISLGVLGLLQKSAVVSAAPISGVRNNYFFQCGLTNCTENNYLITLSLINLVKHNFGLQLGIGNFSADNKGIQIGVFNAGGLFQLGLLNYHPNSYIPWMPFINWDMGQEE